MSRDLAAEEAVVAATKVLREALAAFGEATRGLPPYPSGIHVDSETEEVVGACCAEPDLTVCTTGLEQWCGAEIDFGGEPSVIASTDGWDDMGDMDGPSWMHCAGCGGLFGSGWDWS